MKTDRRETSPAHTEAGGNAQRPRFTVLSDTPIAGCAMPLSRNNTIIRIYQSRTEPLHLRYGPRVALPTHSSCRYLHAPKECHACNASRVWRRSATARKKATPLENLAGLKSVI